MLRAMSVTVVAVDLAVVADVATAIGALVTALGVIVALIVAHRTLSEHDRVEGTGVCIS